MDGLEGVGMLVVCSRQISRGRFIERGWFQVGLQLSGPLRPQSTSEQAQEGGYAPHGFLNPSFLISFSLIIISHAHSDLFQVKFVLQQTPQCLCMYTTVPNVHMASWLILWFIQQLGDSLGKGAFGQVYRAFPHLYSQNPLFNTDI